MLTSYQVEALESTKGLPPTAANLSRLAERVGQGVAAWAFGQWELRKRGQAKFSRSEEMLFTREALEQASHEAVATYHASLFEPGEMVVDMTTGIGGDLIALAQRGPAVGLELDATRASYARHNALVYGVMPEVIVGDSLETPIESQSVFVDPSRRVEGKRTLHLDSFTPNPFALAERFQAMRRAVMKLSPMLSDADLSQFGAQVQFVEAKGECREALLVFGSPPGFVAVQVETGETLPRCELGATREQPQDFLMEASPSAIRAHSLGQLGLAGLGDSNGYLTGDRPALSPWLTTYPVLWFGRPADVPRQLRAMDAATPEIKQRGAGLNLDALKKKWLQDGNQPVFVALYPVGRSLQAAILGQPINDRALRDLQSPGP